MSGNIRTLIKFLLLMIIVFGMLVGIAYAVLNGQPDVDNDYPYVGIVTDGFFVCSCSAISPTVIVTAGHCFDYSEGEPVPVSVSFDQEVDPEDLPVMHEGIWYPHPEYCQACEPGNFGFIKRDVAVIELSEPVVLSRYAELPEEGLVDDLPNNTDVTVVGYGITHWLRGGGPPGWGFPEAGFTRYFAPTRLIPSKHKHNDEIIKLSGDRGQDRGGTCFGDSGGPSLLSDTDTILALTSYGTNPLCAGVGFVNRIDTDAALEFIEGFLD
ncbi:MAG TPA: trypsin-like serine protease [Desulfatiglandales bacterium]|nr:trypsin-like serine protease [Desulfatiglandales bacterium]